MGQGKTDSRNHCKEEEITLLRMQESKDQTGVERCLHRQDTRRRQGREQRDKRERDSDASFVS